VIRLVVLLLLASIGQVWAQTPPQTPFLRIEAGGHIGAVPHLAIDGSGRVMATAGYDKTVRLWSLPDGKQRAVLRPPIGTEQEGELYAVAITPDGRRVFAAGATGGTWDGTFSIYLFDARSGALVGRLPGLPSPVNNLATSPDGSRFAAGLARGGVRVWDAASGRPIFQDAAYQGPVRGITFDREGRLYATAADGKVRSYDADGRKAGEKETAPGQRPWGIAVSPDGSLLAVTYENADRQGRLRIDVLSARTLQPLFARWGLRFRRVRITLAEPGKVAPDVTVAAPVYQRILVPLDHTRLDRTAIAHAAAMARTHHAKLFLFHVEEGVTSQVYGELSSTAGEPVTMTADWPRLVPPRESSRWERSPP
jgi:hypothetical protein